MLPSPLVAVRRSDELLQRHLAKLVERGGAEARRTRWSPLQRGALLGLSGLIVLVYLAFVGLGLWWVVGYFPAPAAWLGALLLAVAVVARPRLGRQSRESRPLTDFPALAALCNDVGAAVGGRPPTRVVFTADMRCDLSTLGLRRTPTLTIGVPGWVAMTPPQRVAALAGEFARRASGDPNAGWLVGGATSIIDETYFFCTPLPYRSVTVDDSLPVAPSRTSLHRSTGMMWFAEQAGRLLQYVVRIVPGLLARALASLSWAGRAAAHAIADTTMVEVAGRDAVREVLRLRSATSVMTGVAQRLANGLHAADDPVDLIANGLRRAIEPGRPLVDGVDRVDPFVVARLATLDALAQQVPGVVLTNQASAAIDTSLAPARAAAAETLRGGAADAFTRPLLLAS